MTEKAEAANQNHPKETLSFEFTPVTTPIDPEAPNFHAQKTTRNPDIVAALRERFQDAVIEAQVYANEDTIRVRRDTIVDVCRYLHDEHAFVYLSDLGGVDRFTEEDRFEVFYNIVSFDPPRRLRLKVRTDESDPTVPSVTPIYRAANWNERECYDMLGIVFEGHEDLRRMYLPEDFEYFPLRKEFPQLGIPGSLPLPPQQPSGELTLDPFAAAHGRKPPKSYEEGTDGSTNTDHSE